MDKNPGSLFGNEKCNYGFVLQSDMEDKVGMTLTLPYEHDFVLWFTMFAEYVDLVYPERFNDKVEDRFRQKWERLKKTTNLLT
ncbi:hypothetical protein J2X69_000149 [Algoriphagus sp. 4150]|uniref:hypothetical protein n=1 Tax=Algoriphagus sp. 4150 TaxID=2817756 RepID=UPI00285CF4C7|nr:hypothetical protein [Algoriphagus sp. 4150]MDR7127821.1 hypothetical protein [Algoriphagus sp. 4150]